MVKYLNPASHQPLRITKTDKEFANTHDFNDIKFPVKIRDIQKIYKKKKKNKKKKKKKKKKKIPLVLMFLAMKIKTYIQSTYQSNVVKKSLFYY